MKWLFLPLPALSWYLVSCNPEKRDPHGSSSPDVTTANQTPAAPSFDVKNPNSLIGQNLEDVRPALEAAEIRFRILEKDGEPMIMTMDYAPERLNFKIKNGVIIEVAKG